MCVDSVDLMKSVVILSSKADRWNGRIDRLLLDFSSIPVDNGG